MVDELLLCSGFIVFQIFLIMELVDDCKVKIQCFNFNKVCEVVDMVVVSIVMLQQEWFQLLFSSLVEDVDGVVCQIGFVVKLMWVWLCDKGWFCIVCYIVCVCEYMYVYIEGDYGNEVFICMLEDCMVCEVQQFVEDVGVVMVVQCDCFEQEIVLIIEMFWQQVEELFDVCCGMVVGGLDSCINLKINIDYGIQIGSFIVMLIGGVVLFWILVGWLLMILFVLMLVFLVYKVICGFLSSEFCQMQQCKMVDENIVSVVDQFKCCFEDGLNEVFVELDVVVVGIQVFLCVLVEQVDYFNQVLIIFICNLQQFFFWIYV